MRAGRLVFGGMALVATLAGAWPAEAGRSPTRRERAAEPGGVWTSATSAARDCSRVRRKFWHADEGWIVRTVVVCR